MMTDYQRTEWVFDNGDCNRCSHLVTEEATQTDPAYVSCSVLDNWSKHSDRCPRMDQFEAALAKAEAEVDMAALIGEALYYDDVKATSRILAFLEDDEDDLDNARQLRAWLKNIRQAAAEASL